PRLLLVASARGQLPVSLPGQVERIALLPLSAEDATTLAATLLQQGLLPAAGRAELVAEVRRLVDEAGGHPLFLQELVTSRPDGAVLPLEEALWARITAL